MKVTFKDDILAIAFRKDEKFDPPIGNFSDLFALVTKLARFRKGEVRQLHLVGAPYISHTDLMRTFTKLDALIIDSSPRFNGQALIHEAGPAQVIFRASGLQALPIEHSKVLRPSLKVLDVVGCANITLSKAIIFIKKAAEAEVKTISTFAFKCKKPTHVIFEPVEELGNIILKVEGKNVKISLFALNGEQLEFNHRRSRQKELSIPISDLQLEEQITEILFQQGWDICSKSDHLTLTRASETKALDVQAAESGTGVSAESSSPANQVSTTSKSRVGKFVWAGLAGAALLAATAFGLIKSFGSKGSAEAKDAPVSAAILPDPAVSEFTETVPVSLDEPVVIIPTNAPKANLQNPNARPVIESVKSQNK